jgi:Ca2+-binding EF-hand superfamily protein
MGQSNSRGRNALRECKIDEGFNEAECKRIWDHYDTNRNGVLDRDEAKRFFQDYVNAKNLSRYRQQNEITRLFSLFDKNGDGKIDWFEMCTKQPIALRRPGLRRQISNPSSDTKLDKIFNKYAGLAEDEEQDLICGSGMERFCSDVKINPENWEGCMLAWKLGAVELGEITRDQFKQGFYDVGATDVKTMRTKCQQLKQSMSTDNEMYHALYRWSFDFMRDKTDTVPKLKMEEAIDGFTTFIRNWPLADKVCTFLTRKSGEEAEFEHCSRDLWDAVWEFSHIIKTDSDLANWDDLCPDYGFTSVLEEFCEEFAQ